MKILRQNPLKHFVLALSVLIGVCMGITSSASAYTDKNQGIVSFDVSNPIDATGYTLKGHNLKGGTIYFTNQGSYLTPLLAHETGQFETPIVTSTTNKPLIKTTINYKAIKFINPNGISNLFIKIGLAERTQQVSSLDPYVLKDGTDTWRVPIFTTGQESNDTHDKSENWQFMQVGTGDDPSRHNGMYTQQFYVITQAVGSSPISGHPIVSSSLQGVLPKAYTLITDCASDGLWGGGGSDPYRTIKGRCQGTINTFPAGPNLDYEYGSFTLPTVESPWTALPQDHCSMEGKRRAGCVNIKIASTINFTAQKIRVPLEQGLVLTASVGTLYRTLNVENLRYQCKDNVYLKDILPKKYCYAKSYKPGGWSAPYFSVGFEFIGKDNRQYVARYIYTPEKENADRIQWNDASTTHIYISTVSTSSGKMPSKEMVKQQFNDALDRIKKHPVLYDVLGKQFFTAILEKNDLK